MQMYDDRATFLLPRPTWVNDNDVAYCSSCNNAFGPLNRRHHCRNCGNIFCHECSNRKVPLPQLGYGSKPVRVCNGCFDVAYLVTYAIDEDHGVSTQAHGVRGLLELAEKDDEKDLHNMVAYGGVDALIWLLRSSKNTKIHHLSTTILAMLVDKESIRPVLITKWALAALLIIIRNYTTLGAHSPNTKKSPANSVHSAGTPSLSSSEATSNTIESPQIMILEIIMNCTHVIYQLSRAGILSQKEIFTDGVFASLLTLASFSMQNVRLESLVVEGSPTIVPTSDENDQQYIENINIIQTLASKSISAISSLIPFQATIIELIQGSNALPSLLRSSNLDVEKYIAKTIAYLSLRNDKYKSQLLSGEGAPALLSIIVKLPQKHETESRFQDLAYYLAQDINVIKSEHKNRNVEEQPANLTAVSHACCALANFATNNESQTILLSQPHLLQYICNVSLVFSTHNEIHRHVARCIANLALYDENNETMLRSDKKYGKKDGYNVLPTLLFMGNRAKPDIQRHIVRAIDNLSSNLKNGAQWKELFGDAYTFIIKFLEESSDSGETDVDTYKRAKNIIAREKLESVNQTSAPVQDSKSDDEDHVTVEEPNTNDKDSETNSTEDGQHSNSEDAINEELSSSDKDTSAQNATVEELNLHGEDKAHSTEDNTSIEELNMSDKDEGKSDTSAHNTEDITSITESNTSDKGEGNEESNISDKDKGNNSLEIPGYGEGKSDSAVQISSSAEDDGTDPENVNKKPHKKSKNRRRSKKHK